MFPVFELGGHPVVRNDLEWLRTSTKWVRTVDLNMLK